MALIKVVNLTKKYKKQIALNDVSFSIERGQTLGLIGESGCGKTTLGRTLLRLIEPSSGKVFFEGSDLFALSQKELKAARRKMQMLFQNPQASLDPRMTIEQIIQEPLKIHSLSCRGALEELLYQVKLPLSIANAFPYQLSGGQCQRVALARALALKPSFIVLDEPTSALDVSIQAQMINLLLTLQKELNLTYLFIAHDLPLVRYISTNIAVMHQGQLIELAPKDELFENPKHPFAKALLAAEAHSRHKTRLKELLALRALTDP